MVQGNFIGTNASGAVLGNSDGVLISDAPNNTIGGTTSGSGNVIAFNTGAGVTVDTGTGNAIRQNSIFANGQGIVQGIVLVNGGNADQPTPTLTAAASFPGTTIVEGLLSGFAPNTTYTVEFFASAPGDPTTPGQAHVFLDSRTFKTDGFGLVPISTTLSATVPVGQVITATATSPGNNTSEFATGVIVASPFVVTKTNNSGIGSLRQAILNANTKPGSDTITFDIPGAGVHTISPASLLPTITEAATIDGTTQPGFAAASDHRTRGDRRGGDRDRADAFRQQHHGAWAGGQPLRRRRHRDHRIGASNNAVLGNYIGTNAAGTAALGNGIPGSGSGGAGVRLGGTSNTIASNVISGNVNEGIFITVGGNKVLDNFIGTNAAGTASLGNGLSGITLQQSAASTIGGNVISGNGVGPFGGNGISLAGSGAQDNVIQANLIGTDAIGTISLGNVFDGIRLNNASSNSIIGNVVSGNGINQDAAGINLESNDRNNIIAGNEIGTNAAGDAALGNSLHGIFLGGGSSNNTIGGPTENDRNVISGNGKFPVADLATQGGVEVYIFGANTSSNVVQRNYIGTNAAGTDALTNSVIGVLINQSPGNTEQGNVISGNRLIGLEIAGGTASGNLVQGNKIGTNAGGTAAIPNGQDGIFVNDAPNNTIGGTAAGAGNLISGNGSVGIQLFGPLTQGNVIEGNALGLDSTGRPTLPNRAGGIFVNTGLLTNQVGGTAPDQANRGQTRQQFTVTGFHQSHAGSKTRHSPPAGRRFHIRGSRTAVLKHGTH